MIIDGLKNKTYLTTLRGSILKSKIALPLHYSNLDMQVEGKTNGDMHMVRKSTSQLVINASI